MSRASDVVTVYEIGDGWGWVLRDEHGDFIRISSRAWSRPEVAEKHAVDDNPDAELVTTANGMAGWKADHDQQS